MSDPRLSIGGQTIFFFKTHNSHGWAISFSGCIFVDFVAVFVCFDFLFVEFSLVWKKWRLSSAGIGQRGFVFFLFSQGQMELIFLGGDMCIYFLWWDGLFVSAWCVALIGVFHIMCPAAQWSLRDVLGGVRFFFFVVDFSASRVG